LNAQQYQNRLRHFQYAEMFKKVGFAILFEERRLDARSLDALSKMTLARKFRCLSAEELACIESVFLIGASP
jgi:hypothetical protein